jgi:hypothetical protein
METLKMIGAIILVLWLLGLFFKIGGRLIHTLLVVAAVIYIFNYLT